MTITKFTFLVVNICDEIDPLYKATCISGYGHGYGKTVQEAIEQCRQHVSNIVDVCIEVNIPLELVSKEVFKQTADMKQFHIDDWDDNRIQWVEIDHKEINKRVYL